MRVLMVGPSERTGGVSTHTKELTQHLRKLGVKVERYKTDSYKDCPTLLDKLIKVYKKTVGLSIKLLKESRKFDIVHIQASGPLGGLLPAIVGAFWKKILSNFNLIVTFHYRPDERFLRDHKRIFEFIFSQTDAFFVVSQRQIENIRKIFGDYVLQKIMLTYNGFSSEHFYPMNQELCRKQLRLPLDKKILLNVANLVPIKGHKYLIEAIKNVITVKQDIMLIIVGDGSLRKALDKQIKKLNLESYVKLVGFKSHSEIPLWMNAADLFVLPSLMEGNPTVMFEALGVGLPFIGTAVGGVSEIITSEEYGLLCPPADSECLAEKILIALEKEWDREKIKKYAEQFTWDNIALKTLNLYMEVLHHGKD